MKNWILLFLYLFLSAIIILPIIIADEISIAILSKGRKPDGRQNLSGLPGRRV